MTIELDDIRARLERIALCAEVANHWTDDMRLMPAAGVADTIYEGMARIDALVAEVERLRGLFSELADEYDDPTLENGGPASWIARAALKGADDD
jgi:hypothetical protein